MAEYLFDNAHASARDRFTALEQRYDLATTALLTQLGVPRGGRCLEIGGGGGSIARWLADQVGPGGSVLATDIDTSKLRGERANLEIRRHDVVTDRLPEAEFDLVHARLVLIHIPERHQVLDRILRTLRPGGYLLLDEFDVTWSHVLRAPDPAGAELFAKVAAAIHRTLELGGMDLAWGRHAYGAMEAAGYVALGARGFCESWRGGSAGGDLYRANLRQVENRILARALATRAELDAFHRLVEDPRMSFTSYLMISTWGRRPD